MVQVTGIVQCTNYDSFGGCCFAGVHAGRGNIFDEPASESIHDRLASEQSEVRAAALAELLQTGADVSPHLEAVAACVSDPVESQRLLALLLLGRHGAAAAEYFPAALDPQQPDSVRAAAAAIIAGIGPPAAASVRGLCRCLTSADENLRNAAAVALAKIGVAAVPSLRIMLQFSNTETIAAAVESLAIIGRPAEAAVPELQALAARSPLPLQLACAAALCRLTGDPERGLPSACKSSRKSRSAGPENGGGKNRRPRNCRPLCQFRTSCAAPRIPMKLCARLPC